MAIGLVDMINRARKEQQRVVAEHTHNGEVFVPVTEEVPIDSAYVTQQFAVGASGPPEAPKLERVKLPEPNLKDERHALAVKAQELLGYKGLHAHLKLAGPLGKVLNQLSIEPFDPDVVERYKCFKRDEVNGERGIFGRYNWVMVPISEYWKPIPEFALRKAVQVKEKCPDAQFFVDHLAVIPDPFFVAFLGDERYWFEVWDEAKFESENV